jgi:predicted transcriptional regulator of viral defense system
MDRNGDHESRSLTAFVNDHQAKGRYTFTQSEAAGAIPVTGLALEAALRGLRKRGRIANPRRGFYVIVPLEYREAGCPPADWFIHDVVETSRKMDGDRKVFIHEI